MDFAEEYSSSDSTRSDFFYLILCLLALGMIVFSLSSLSNGLVVNSKNEALHEPTHSIIHEESVEVGDIMNDVTYGEWFE